MNVLEECAAASISRKMGIYAKHFSTDVDSILSP
jgi:hypothetical protein